MQMKCFQYWKASSETPEAGRKHQLNQLKNLFLCKFELHGYSKSSDNTRWQVTAI